MKEFKEERKKNYEAFLPEIRKVFPWFLISIFIVYVLTDTRTQDEGFGHEPLTDTFGHEPLTDTRF